MSEVREIRGARRSLAVGLVALACLAAGCSSSRPTLRNTEPRLAPRTSGGEDIDQKLERKVTKRLSLPE